MIGQRVCFILDSSDLMRLYPTLILNKQMDEQLAWSHGALWGVWGLLTALLSVDYVQHTTALRHKHTAKNQHITWTDSCSSKPETVHRVKLSIRYFYLIKFGTITGNQTPKIIHYVHWSDAASRLLAQSVTQRATAETLACGSPPHARRTNLLPVI